MDERGHRDSRQHSETVSHILNIPTEPNDPAYPTPLMDGLTKREYFSGLAMRGLIADPSCNGETCAKTSVHFADALIAELNKTTAES